MGLDGGGCTLEFDEEVLVVIGIRLECDAWNGVGLNDLCLLDNSRAGSLHFC